MKTSESETVGFETENFREDSLRPGVRFWEAGV